ncbi:MAG: cytochrome b N-terminal domain-containing protein [Bacteroidales bacterium]|nr:cytochrome b N-terminal domain-containing protein [Bacteroidales bacterium]
MPGTDNISNSPEKIYRKRVRKITRNFFLHIHSPRIYPFSMKPGYTFGLGIVLGFLFLIMIFTGVLLMLHYTPSVESAYNSVKDIVHVVPGGRIIRNIHRLASHAMVITVFLHLLRVFYTGSYLGGRYVNWIIGVAMFVVVLFMSFSGYLLPWDQLSYWAVTIGSNIAASARELTDLLGITGILDIGGFFQRLLIGSETVGQTALTRFFMLHVIFLPLTLLVLTAVHLWRIRKEGGLSRPVAISSRETDKLLAWPMLMWVELSIFLSVIALLVLFSFFIEAPLLEPANPSHPENPAKSPWYFLGIQELVSYSAFAGGLLVPVLFLYFLVSIPYKDKEEQYIGVWFSGRRGIKVLLYAILLSVFTVCVQVFVMVRWGWLRNWFPDISQWFVMLVNPATITVMIFAAYSVYIRRKSGSSRMAAISLFTSSMVALIIFTAIGIWFRGANWEFVFR